VNFAAIERLRTIAAGAGASMARFALAWVLANPAVTAVVNGATSVPQLEENIAATEVKLSQDILAACDQVWHMVRPPTTVFYGR
jgi:aryl-alcohol dehydrogenase-like predicted oxidoreductase